MNRRKFLQLGALGLGALAFPTLSYAKETEQNIPEEVIKAAKSVGVTCTLHSGENARIGTGTILEDLLITAHHVWDYSFGWGDDGLYIKDTRLVCIGNNPESDIAVFQVPKDAKELHSKYQFKLPQLSVGQKVYAYTPGDEEIGEFKEGRIYGRLQEMTDTKNDTYKNLVPTTCKVVPGYSGGPVFNELGEVVGVSTHKISDKNDIPMGGFFSPLTNARFKRLE